LNLLIKFKSGKVKYVQQLNLLRLEVAIDQGSSPALVAIFEGANDLIELR